jgi:hypothetical protein
LPFFSIFIMVRQAGGDPGIAEYRHGCGPTAFNQRHKYTFTILSHPAL